MSMQSASIDAIFTKLALTYGRDFTDRYAALDPLAVKADWARELFPWLNKPAAIRFALDNLPPGKPPTSIEFRALCNRAPEIAPKRLPAPKTDAERVRSLLSRAKDAVGRAWIGKAASARRLQARSEAGEIRLTQAQREWIRAVLSREGPWEDEQA
jgi:hypothetical protein